MGSLYSLVLKIVAMVGEDNSNLEKYTKQGTEHNVPMRLPLIKAHWQNSTQFKIAWSPLPTPSIAQPNKILWQKSLCCEINCRWKQTEESKLFGAYSWKWLIQLCMILFFQSKMISYMTWIAKHIQRVKMCLYLGNNGKMKWAIGQWCGYFLEEFFPGAKHFSWSDHSQLGTIYCPLHLFPQRWRGKYSI